MIEVRRAGERFRTRLPWWESRHSFSYGHHYDPTNTSYGLLVVHNDDVLQPRSGFEPHPHRDSEIVTWVLHGSLVHEDSLGNRAVTTPGVVQRVSAGSGIVHTERNDSDEPVRFVQTWVLPDETGPPEYAQADLSEQLATGDLVPVAGGEASVRLRQSGAALHVARLSGAVRLPRAPHVHVYVAAGGVDVEGVGRLDEGDALRADGGAQRVTGTGELLVWEMRPSAP